VDPNVPTPGILELQTGAGSLTMNFEDVEFLHPELIGHRATGKFQSTMR
jgi:hypothetical protein